MNKETINWFGKPIKKKIISQPSYNSVSFLGLKSSNKNSKTNIPKNVNFFGLKSNKKMSPSPLFRKESIKRGKRKLSKWGDADLDGSPNYFDCDPRKAFKDAKRLTGGEEQAMLGSVIENISLRKKKEKEKRSGPGKGMNLKTYAMQKIKGRIDALSLDNKKKVYNSLDKIGELTQKNIRPSKRSAERYSALGEEKRNATEAAAIREDQRQTIEGLYKKGKMKQEVYDAAVADIDAEEAQDKKRGDKISSIETRTEKLKAKMKIPGLAGQEASARFTIEEKIARGKKPSQKELRALTKIERKMSKFGDIQQEGKISREILTKVPLGEVGRVISGAAVTKSGEYSKALKAKSARVRRMTDFATGSIFGNLTHGAYASSEPRARGRPPGPSGEYKIGGKPVYEQEFQNYASKQNAMNKMLPSNTQSQTLNPEYIAYMKAKAVSERQPGQSQVMTEEGMPMEGQVMTEETEMPTTGTSMMQTGEQQEMIRQKRAYTQAMPDEIRQAQQAAQMRDNILNAPSFMRGELKATGGSLLTPIGPSILEAPKVFQGEMRNVTKPDINEGEVKLGERPQTNPYGDEYLDIELGSGKPVLKRRISERWMTGEAL